MRLSKEQTLVALAILMLLKAGLYCFGSASSVRRSVPFVRLAGHLSRQWEGELLAVFREIEPWLADASVQEG